MKIVYIGYISIVLVVCGLSAIVNARKIKKVSHIRLSEKGRLKMYKDSILLAWISMAAVVLLSLLGKISLYDLGVRDVIFRYSIWFTSYILMLFTFCSLYFLYQIASFLLSEKSRKQMKEDLSKDSLMNNMIIPRTKKEKMYFIGLSLTAGITEEFIFRAFLYFLIASVFPHLSMIYIVLITSLLFGIFHLYQGYKGVIKTALFGALLGFLYIVTDNLVLPILLHSLADTSAAFLVKEEEPQSLFHIT